MKKNNKIVEKEGARIEVRDNFKRVSNCYELNRESSTERSFIKLDSQPH